MLEILVGVNRRFWPQLFHAMSLNDLQLLDQGRFVDQGDEVVLPSVEGGDHQQVVGDRLVLLDANDVAESEVAQARFAKAAVQRQLVVEPVSEADLLPQRPDQNEGRDEDVEDQVGAEGGQKGVTVYETMFGWWSRRPRSTPC